MGDLLYIGRPLLASESHVKSLISIVILRSLKAITGGLTNGLGGQIGTPFALNFGIQLVRLDWTPTPKQSGKG